MLSVFRMVLKSIGYKSVPVNGLPFDNHKGKKQKIDASLH